MREAENKTNITHYLLPFPFAFVFLLILTSHTPILYSQSLSIRSNRHAGAIRLHTSAA